MKIPSITEEIVKIPSISEESNQKPLSKLQNRDASKTGDNWEFVPPDGGKQFVSGIFFSTFHSLFFFIFFPREGWGWLVLAGSTLVNILIPGTVKSFGVLFMEFLEAFDASPKTALWIPALCYFLYSSLGLVYAIVNSYQYIKVNSIIGKIFQSL